MAEEMVEERSLEDSLKELLANNIAMFLKASGFHWNVEGRDFYQFHAFFKEIYEDVYSAVDPTAENLRKLGTYAPFTLPTLDKLREVDDKKVTTDPIVMCVDLNDANDLLLECLGECFALATKANEQGIANFIAERDDMHKKWRWQLTSILK